MSSTSLREEVPFGIEEQVTALSDLCIADAHTACPTVVDYPRPSPFLKLPDEILSKVFIYCDGEIVTLPVSEDTWPAWSRLGFVCSHWRHVLWSSPYLLNRVEFEEGIFADNILLSSFRDLVTKLFSRNNGLLSVKIVWDGADDIIDVIALHSHRIRYLSLVAPEDQTLISLFSVSAGSFSQLEHLSIDGTTLTQPHYNGEIPSLGTAPNLHTVTITDNHDYFKPAGPLTFLIAFRQLINLKIEDQSLPPSFIHNILCECTSLVHLDVYVSGSGEAQLSKITILMENLESLSVTGNAQFDWDCLLQPLVCPLLKNLSLHEFTFTHEDHSPASLQPSISLIKRSACSRSLEHFRMTEFRPSHVIHHHHDIPLLDSDIKALFQLLPSLVTFYTTFVLPPEAFKLIQVGFLPSLEEFQGSIYPDGLHTFLDLIEFLAMPNPHRCQLRKLDISCRDGPGLEEARQCYLETRQTYKHILSAQWTVYFSNL